MIEVNNATAMDIYPLLKDGFHVTVKGQTPENYQGVFIRSTGEVVICVDGEGVDMTDDVQVLINKGTDSKSRAAWMKFRSTGLLWRINS
jgi:hypothetical protein